MFLNLDLGLYLPIYCILIFILCIFVIVPYKECIRQTNKYSTTTTISTFLQYFISKLLKIKIRLLRIFLINWKDKSTDVIRLKERFYLNLWRKIYIKKYSITNTNDSPLFKMLCLWFLWFCDLAWQSVRDWPPVEKYIWYMEVRGSNIFSFKQKLQYNYFIHYFIPSVQCQLEVILVNPTGLSLYHFEFFDTRKNFVWD